MCLHAVSNAENKESAVGKVKEESTDSLETLHCKASSLVANSTEQGSTLRDLLTTTAGKLRLGSTDAGIAFAPVYSTASQVSHHIIHTTYIESSLLHYGHRSRFIHTEKRISTLGTTI